MFEMMDKKTIIILLVLLLAILLLALTAPSLLERSLSWMPML